MGLRCYCRELMSTFPASNIYGWMLATGARTRARTGCKRPSDGVWISSSAPESLPQRKCLWRGLSTMVARGRGGRLAEADATEGVGSAGEEVGGVTLFRLVDVPQ